MKSLLVTAFILASASSYAATCFKAVDPISKKSKLPEVVCVDSFRIDLVTPELPEKPNYHATIVSDAGTLIEEYLSFKGENDSYKTEVRKSLVSEGGACEASYSSTLKFTITVNKKVKVVENGLSVSGVVTSSPDSCHSSDRVTTIRYEAI